MIEIQEIFCSKCNGAIKSTRYLYICSCDEDWGKVKKNEELKLEHDKNIGREYSGK